MISFLKFINQSDEDKYNMLLEAAAEIHGLEEENKQLKANRDEAIEYIENEGFGYDITGDGYYCLGEEEQKELLSILERGKEC